MTRNLVGYRLPVDHRRSSAIEMGNMIFADTGNSSHFWTMLIIFAFVIWLLLLFVVLADIFRRHDTSGWVKVLWIIFVIVLPFLGVFVYLVAEHDGMTERSIEREQGAQKQTDEYIKSVVQTSPAEQITQAKELLDSGAITQAEFDQIKQQALAG